VFEIIEQVERVGTSMNEAVGQVTDTMEKGKEITAEISKLSDKIK